MTELGEEVQIFLVEANENLDAAEADLIALEGNPSDSEVINSVFRNLHTIKGNCGFLGYSRLEKLCHSTETVLDRVREGQLAVSSENVGVLLKAIDAIRVSLVEIETTGKEADVDYSELQGELVRLLG